MDAESFEQMRLISFGSIFAVMAVLEVIIPRRKLRKSKPARWFSNITLTFLSSLSGRYALPFTGVTAAIFASERGMGFFNNTDVNPILKTIFIIVMLDMIIYWQHVFFHRIPILWKLHKVHHADPDYDVTTGARFHPIEIVLSMVIKIIFIFVLGADVFSVVLFEMILNGMAMFNHSNIKFNKSVDSVLRKVIVSPDFHRVHHSTLPREHHSNFGFNLSIWDYIFKTYRQQPEKGHEEMDIGLDYISEDSKSMSIFGMLLTPFLKDKK